MNVDKSFMYEEKYFNDYEKLQAIFKNPFRKATGMGSIVLNKVSENTANKLSDGIQEMINNGKR